MGLAALLLATSRTNNKTKAKKKEKEERDADKSVTPNPSSYECNKLAYSVAKDPQQKQGQGRNLILKLAVIRLSSHEIAPSS